MASVTLQDRESDSTYRAPRANLQLRDFDVIGRIGDGSFSTVILARLRETGMQSAIKIVNKHLIVRNKMVDYVRAERNILDQLSDNDGICKLLFTFQDADSLYFGCEYCPGGDLFEQIERQGKLQLQDARFYAAEIVQILEYLREKQVVHRDMKPENLLLTSDGHLKLTDFGSAKAFFLPPIGGVGKQKRTTSFVGTAEYVSPEVLNNLPLSYPADLWALGCVIHQMLAGRPPFKAASEYLTFQKVCERDFEFPPDFPPDARDLVDKLLAVDPADRIGSQDLDEVKRHAFFAGIDWATLRQQKAPDFVAPAGPTPEAEALDWELTSLVRENMNMDTLRTGGQQQLGSSDGSAVQPGSSTAGGPNSSGPGHHPVIRGEGMVRLPGGQQGYLQQQDQQQAPLQGVGTTGPGSEGSSDTNPGSQLQHGRQQEPLSSSKPAPASVPASALGSSNRAEQQQGLGGRGVQQQGRGTRYHQEREELDFNTTKGQWVYERNPDAEDSSSSEEEEDDDEEEDEDGSRQEERGVENGGQGQAQGSSQSRDAAAADRDGTHQGAAGEGNGGAARPDQEEGLP